jgi:hypothetical protein
MKPTVETEETYVEKRPKLTVSEQFMADMIPMIRRQFCPDWDDHNWNMHLWLVQRTVTYPAAWLNKKSLFVTEKRYRVIFLRLLVEIKRKAKGEIKFPPGYLLKCVQDHMKFNADRYNAEGKKARDSVSRVLKAVSALPVGNREDELVRTLAEASKLITRPKRRKKNPEPAPAPIPEPQKPEIEQFDMFA